MIAIVFQAGRSFQEASHYIAEDLRRAEVLAFDGIRGRDYRLMGHDFELQHRLRPEVEKPVFHAVLSFAFSEEPGDDKSVRLAREWMEAIGITGTQSAFIKHTDTAHLHVHILANRIDDHGGIVGEGLVIERGIRAARALTKKYGLQPEGGKNPGLINRGALNAVEARRYRLYDAIREELPHCRELEELEARLLARGITTRYKIDGGTGARIGVSFRIEGYAFKGSQVDADFSIRGLRRKIAEQKAMVIGKGQKVVADDRVLAVENEQKQKVERKIKRGKGHWIGKAK